MNKKKANVLGTNYELKILSQENLQKIYGQPAINVWGLCDYRTKTIFLDKEIAQDKYNYNTTLRHELIHAILEECGIGSQVSWAKDETLVDWIALQFPKIQKLFKEFNIED